MRSRSESSLKREENSSIVVQVDLMICISTSINLRESVLRQAGPAVADKYRAHKDQTKGLLTDGGATAATKILFIPWQEDLPLSNLDAIRQVFLRSSTSTSMVRSPFSPCPTWYNGRSTKPSDDN